MVLGIKICTICKQEKDCEQFFKCKNEKLGRYSQCKLCCKEKDIVRSKAYYLRNKEKTNKRTADYYRQNKPHWNEWGKTWYKENRDRKQELGREWYRNNPEFIRHKQAIKRAVILQRMPKWANRKEIKKVYKQAKELSDQTGLDYHVDHDIPLRGENVSGLHVHNNLKILLAEDNLKKSNKFDV